MSGKKQTRADEIKQSITDYLNSKGDNPFVVARCSMNGRGINHFLTITTSGLLIVDYKQKIAGIVETHSFTEWSSVEIDHYAMKSIFTFSGISGTSSTSTFTTLELGKKVERALRTQSSLTVKIIPRPIWRKILGYRSKTRGKMISASIIYMVLILLVITHSSGSSNNSASTDAINVNTSSNTELTISKAASVTKTTSKSKTSNQLAEQKKAMQQEVLAYYEKIIKTATQADNAIKQAKSKLNEVMNGRIDQLTVYDDLGSFSDTCFNENMTLMGMAAPSDLPQKIQDDFNQGTQNLAIAYFSFSQGLKKEQSYLNDPQIALLSQSKQDFSDGQNEMISGATYEFSAKMDAGIK